MPVEMSGSLRVQVVWNVMAHHWMRLYCPERSSHSVMMQHHISRKTNTTVIASSQLMKCLSRSIAAVGLASCCATFVSQLVVAYSNLVS